MKKWSVLGVLSCVVGLFLFAAGTAAAQDIVKVAPKNAKVLLENDQVRVIEFHSKAGEKIPMHSHPAYVVYAISGGKTKYTGADGKQSEAESKAGAATWRDAEKHASEAAGPGEAHAILVELKGHAAPAPAAAAKAPEKKAKN